MRASFFIALAISSLVSAQACAASIRLPDDVICHIDDMKTDDEMAQCRTALAEDEAIRKNLIKKSVLSLFGDCAIGMSKSLPGKSTEVYIGACTVLLSRYFKD